MATPADVVRLAVMSPPLDDVLFAVRGFHETDPAARELLEMSGRQFVIGFEFAMQSANPDQLNTRLHTLEHRYHGFAYEGAAMALTLRDALRPGPRGQRTERFLEAGPGADHIYMAYLGIGFALARLPRPLWRRAIPDVSRLPDHPTLSWFIWDGYGFHQAFFHPDRWIHQQYVTDRYPWPAGYVNRAVDQGIGRAMWFYHGASVEGVAEGIERFPAARRADLWSGVGVAATYAGGADETQLKQLLVASAPHTQQVRLGAVLAAKARVLAGTTIEHTELATAILCERPAVDAAEITNVAVIDLPPDGEEPAYETFRDRIRQLVT